MVVLACSCRLLAVKARHAAAAVGIKSPEQPGNSWICMLHQQRVTWLAASVT
jgi:hypothetical protein